MYTVIVKYQLAQPVPRIALLEAFEQAAPMFQSVPKLIRKYFCYDEANHCGHSVYLFESEADARAFFNEGFMALMKEKFDTVPELFFVDTLMVVDNEQNKVINNPV